MLIQDTTAIAAAAQVSKRRRIEAGAHDTFASAMTATQRFFSSSAMLRRLVQYCSLERVDLLSLALVSRALRIAAMQCWAMHLDLALSKVCIRLRLFAACPSLLAWVRLVRIRNDLAQWAELKLFLAMLATHVSSTSPSAIFDITVALTEANQLSTAFEPFPKLLKRVVAVRIIPDIENKMLSNLVSAADRNKLTDYKRNWSTSWSYISIQALDLRLEFVKRHQGFIGTAVTQIETEITSAKHCSTAFPDDVYPKLQVLSASASMLEAHAAAGGTLSHYPKTAGAITCLELRQNLKPETLLPHVRALLASDLLPQLTELSLDYESSTVDALSEPRLRNFSAGERRLAQILKALLPALSLQLVGVYDKVYSALSSTSFSSTDVMVDFDQFPISL
ncbi:hypothetical protein OC844_004042, partial [Tilletia horrida]